MSLPDLSLQPRLPTLLLFWRRDEEKGSISSSSPSGDISPAHPRWWPRLPVGPLPLLSLSPFTLLSPFFYSIVLLSLLSLYPRSSSRFAPSSRYLRPPPASLPPPPAPSTPPPAPSPPLPPPGPFNTNPVCSFRVSCVTLELGRWWWGTIPSWSPIRRRMDRRPERNRLPLP